LSFPVLGITRQGNLKLWVELSVPENFLNLEEYLEKGFDGVLINLDELTTRIGGFNPKSEEGIFYRKQVKAVLKLLEPALKLLHKEKILTVVTGELAIHDDVLDFLVEKGAYGISVDSTNFLSIHERLRLIEKRVIKLRS
jgi:phosphoenolpyruvate synthase/pyruvate phosphate dikinase